MKLNRDQQLKRMSEQLRARKSLFFPAIALAVLLLIVLLYLAFAGSGARKGGKPLGVRDAIDSLAAVLPKGSQVVARFPDEERHSLYYLNSGVMYCFDAKFKNLEEIMVSGYESGSIVKAELTPDEKFILLTLHGATANKLYQLNTDTRNITDMNKEVAFEEADKADEAAEEEKPKKAKAEKAAAEETAAESGAPAELEQLPVDTKDIRLPEDGNAGTSHNNETSEGAQ